MKPKRGHKHGTAISVVSEVDDVLHARSNIDTTPDVCGVIGLDNVFADVIESTVANDEAVASLDKVPLVAHGNRIAHNGQTARLYRRRHAKP